MSTNAWAGKAAGTSGPGVTNVASASKVNINWIERISSVAAGLVLFLRGLRLPPLALAGAVLVYRGITGHSYLYGALGISTARRKAAPVAFEEAPTVSTSVTIRKPPDEVYRAWRDPRNLSLALGRFGEVTEAGDGRTHWVLRAIRGRTLEWDSRYTEDRPGEFLRWESLQGATVPNEGSVLLTPGPGDWGTELTLHFQFHPPGGRFGRRIVRALGAGPRLLAAQGLRRFKSLLETGEVPTTEGQPAGRKRGGG